MNGEWQVGHPAYGPEPELTKSTLGPGHPALTPRGESDRKDWWKSELNRLIESSKEGLPESNIADFVAQDLERNIDDDGLFGNLWSKFITSLTRTVLKADPSLSELESEKLMKEWNTQITNDIDRANFFIQFYDSIETLLLLGADIDNFASYSQVIGLDDITLANLTNDDIAEINSVIANTLNKIQRGEGEYPSWLDIDKEEEEKVREFLTQEPEAPALSLQRLTISEIIKAQSVQPSIKPPEGMSMDEVIRVASLMDLDPDSIQGALDIDSIISVIRESTRERENIRDEVLAGISEWEVPDKTLGEKLKFMVQSPMQQMANLLRPYIKNVAYPLTGMAALLFGKFIKAYNIEEDYNSYKAAGYDMWTAAGMAWEENDTEWYWKLPLEILADPLTYTPGILLKVPGNIIKSAGFALLKSSGGKVGAAATSRAIIGSGIELIGTKALALNKGLYEVLDIPWDAIKWFQRKRVIKTFSQAISKQTDDFSLKIHQAVEVHTGKLFGQWTVDDLEKTLIAAQKEFASGKPTNRTLYELGHMLSQHRPMTGSQIFQWSKSHGGRLVDPDVSKVPDQLISEVNQIIDDTLMGVGSKEFNATRLANALMIDVNPKNLDALAKEILRFGAKKTIDIRKIIRMGKAAKIGGVEVMIDSLTKTYKSITNDIVKGASSNGSFLEGIFLGLQRGVDKIENNRLRLLIDRYWVRPLAQANLGSLSYPIWNALEGFAVNMIEGVIPRFMKEDTYLMLTKGLLGDPTMKLHPGGDISQMFKVDARHNPGAWSLLPKWYKTITIGLSDGIGAALRRNFIAKKFQRYLAEKSIQLADGDVYKALGMLGKNVPKISKSSLGLTPNELRDELLRRALSSTDDMLALKKVLTDGTLSKAEMHKIVAKAEFLSPRSKALADELIEQGGIFTPGKISTLVDWGKVSFDKSLSTRPHLVEKVKNIIDDMPSDAKIKIEKVEIDPSLKTRIGPDVKLTLEDDVAEDTLLLLNKLDRGETLTDGELDFLTEIVEYISGGEIKLFGDAKANINIVAERIRQIRANNGEFIVKGKPKPAQAEYDFLTGTLRYADAGKITRDITYHEIGHSVIWEKACEGNYDLLNAFLRASGKQVDLSEINRLIKEGYVNTDDMLMLKSRGYTDTQIDNAKYVSIVKKIVGEEIVDDAAEGFSRYMTGKSVRKDLKQVFDEYLPKAEKPSLKDKTSGIDNFIKQITDTALEDINLYPYQISDNFTNLANMIDDFNVQTRDDLMQVFTNFEVMSETATYMPHRVMSNTMEEAQALRRAGKYKDVEKLWKTRREDLLKIMDDINTSLERVRTKLTNNIDKLTPKQQRALEGLLERAEANRTLYAKTLESDRALLDDIWSRPKSQRTSEVWEEVFQNRANLWYEYEVESAVHSASEFVTRRKLSQLYHNMPKKKFKPVNASNRALTEADIAKVFGVHVDNLTSGILDNLSMHGKEYFVQLVKQSADEYPEIFRGFTEAKIAKVYDKILRKSRIKGDITTSKVINQINDIKAELNMLRMKRALDMDEEKALHKWIDDAVEERNKIIGDAPEVSISRTDIPTFYKMFGAKSELSDQIIEKIGYVEGNIIDPFYGTGAVPMRLKQTGNLKGKIIASEADPNTYNVHLMASTRGDELYNAVENIYKSAPDNTLTLDILNDMKTKYNAGIDDPVEKAATWIVLNRHARFNNISLSKSGKITSGFKVDKDIPGKFTTSMSKRLRSAIDNSKDIDIRLASKDTYIDMIRNAKKGDVIYLDPPYISRVNKYPGEARVGNWTSDDFNRLLSEAKDAHKRGVNVVISEADKDALSKAGFNVTEISTSVGNKKLKSTEVVGTLGKRIEPSIGLKSSKSGKTLISQDEWNKLRQEALDDANKDYYKSFADYSNETIVNGIMKMIYPYWSYHTYRWFYLTRAAVRHPGLPAAWGKYENYSENGYVPTWMPDIEMNPFVGSILGTTFTLTRNDFSSYYDQLGWAGEMLDYSQRLGFFPGPHFTLPIALTSYFSNRKAELSEITPPPVRTVLNIFTASDIPGVNTAAKWLKDKIFHENFQDYMTATILSNMQIEADGNIIIDQNTGEPQSGIDIWMKIQRGEKLTDEEQFYWNEAYQKASLVGALRSQFPIFRLRTEEYKEAYKQVTTIITEYTGMSEEQQKELWKNHMQPSDIMGGYSLELEQALDELWQWKIMLGRGTILMPPDVQDIKIHVDEYYNIIRNYQADRLNEQSTIDNNFLQINTSQPFNGSDWRNNYSRNWSKYTDRVEGLKLSERFRDIEELLSPEGQLEVAERLGFTVPARYPLDEAIDYYFEIELEMKADPITGEEDYDYTGFWLKREAVRMALTPEQREEFDDYVSRYKTPMEETFRYAYDNYIRGYMSINRIIINEFNDDEKSLIKEFYSNTTTMDRREQIRQIETKGGTKLISTYERMLSQARENLRLTTPKLDFYLYVFGYLGNVTDLKTDAARNMVTKWENDRESILYIR